MVGLLGRRPKQHVQRVANNLHDGSAVREHSVGHLPEIIVEQRRDDVRLEHLDKRREPSHVGE